MPISLKELKKLYKQSKILLKTLKKFYRNGVALRMVCPLVELQNAEKQVKYYKEQIENYYLKDEYQSKEDNL